MPQKALWDVGCWDVAKWDLVDFPIHHGVAPSHGRAMRRKKRRQEEDDLDIFNVYFTLKTRGR